MGFGVKNGKNLNEVVQKTEQESAAKGLTKVKANRAVRVTSADEVVSIWYFLIPEKGDSHENVWIILVNIPQAYILGLVQKNNKSEMSGFHVTLQHHKSSLTSFHFCWYLSGSTLRLQQTHNGRWSARIQLRSTQGTFPGTNLRKLPITNQMYWNEGSQLITNLCHKLVATPTGSSLRVN